jgi:hypothetical protein
VSFDENSSVQRRYRQCPFLVDCLQPLDRVELFCFLGAGATFHCVMTNGKNMPMTDRLSNLLSKKFSVRKAKTLGGTAELVEASHTRGELNSYIIELLTGEVPSRENRMLDKRLLLCR